MTWQDLPLRHRLAIVALALGLLIGAWWFIWIVSPSYQ